jgi:glycosyltransferase involved in cell wall biosynthesis
MSHRILYLIGQLHSGGSERQLYYLLREMNRSRYRPAVAVWNFSEKDIYVAQIRSLAVPIFFFAGSSSSTKLRSLRGLVRKLKPEVLHSYSAYLNFAVHWSTRRTSTIGIGSARSDFVFDWEGSSRWLACLNARWPRKQIYNSFEAAKLASRSKSQFVPKQVFVVQNGVDFDHFRMFPLPDKQGPNIVGIGSLIAVKRWDRLLSVARELTRRNLEFSVQVAGDGPLRGSLEQQVQELGVSDRVIFRGYTDDIPGFLSNAAFLVHTSDAEGSPNAIMEAMACGRAVVATDVGDITSLVEDGKTGFIVRRGDDAMLVERIENLIVDRDLCRRMGEMGRAKAEREFGLDRLVAGTLAVYRTAGWNDAWPDGLSCAAEHIA